MRPPEAPARRGAWIAPALVGGALLAAALSFSIHCRGLVEAGGPLYALVYAAVFPPLVGVIVVLGGVVLMRGGNGRAVAAAYALTAPSFINWIFNLVHALHGMRG
jgi:hypothetical protein